MSPGRPRVRQLLIALAGLLAFAGCKGFETTKDIGYYSVKAKQTRVYLFAPGQKSAGDPVLAQGQRVVMLRREFGFSRVMTADGVKGYAKTDDLELAAAQGNEAVRLSPMAMLSTAGRPPQGAGTPGTSSANRSVLQSGPLFGTDVLPLPQDPDVSGLPPLPASKPKPNFRINVPPQPVPAPEKP